MVTSILSITIQDWLDLRGVPQNRTSDWPSWDLRRRSLTTVQFFCDTWHIEVSIWHLMLASQKPSHVPPIRNSFQTIHRNLTRLLQNLDSVVCTSYHFPCTTLKNVLGDTCLVWKTHLLVLEAWTWYRQNFHVLTNSFISDTKLHLDSSEEGWDLIWDTIWELIWNWLEQQLRDMGVTVAVFTLRVFLSSG